MTLPQHMLRSTAYDLAEALDVNELYQQKGWTDGLPIVPPTEKRVSPNACRPRRFRPSCAGRRMAQTATHLVERIIPWVPAHGTLGEAGRPRAPAAGPPGALWRLSGTAQPPAGGDYLRAMPTAVPSLHRRWVVRTDGPASCSPPGASSSCSCAAPLVLAACCEPIAGGLHSASACAKGFTTDRAAFASVSHPSALKRLRVCQGVAAVCCTSLRLARDKPRRLHQSLSMAGPRLRRSARRGADGAQPAWTSLVFAGFPYCAGGGWIPARIQIDRASTMRGWFMRNRTIVALPVGVKPRRTCPLCIHSKCSAQLWIRGLNRGTVSPVSGSGAAVACALLRLQLGQDKQRFSSASGPSG